MIVESDSIICALFRHIMDGQFNTSLPIFNPTEERLKVVDFSTSVYDEANVLVTKLPIPTRVTVRG